MNRGVLRFPGPSTFLFATVLLGACGGTQVTTGTPTASSPPSLAPSPSADASAVEGSASASPSTAFGLAGDWHRDQSCEETAELFESLDLHALGAEYITGIGFRSESPEIVAADADLCTGASGPTTRTLRFAEGGDWSGTSGGEQVDLGTFSIVDDRSILLPGDSVSPEVVLVYQVDGDVVTFTVRPPDPCTEKACIEQVAWAKETFQLGPWTRG